MRASVLLLAVLAGGCAFDNSRETAADNRPGADSRCASVAADRTADAAENGIEKPLLEPIYRDAYRHCVESPAKFYRAY